MRKQESSILAERLIEDETTVARVAFPISEENSCPSGADHTTFVNTTSIRKTEEVSNSRLKKGEPAVVNEAKWRSHRVDPGRSNQQNSRTITKSTIKTPFSRDEFCRGNCPMNIRKTQKKWQEM